MECIGQGNETSIDTRNDEEERPQKEENEPTGRWAGLYLSFKNSRKIL